MSFERCSSHRIAGILPHCGDIRGREGWLEFWHHWMMKASGCLSRDEIMALHKCTQREIVWASFVTTQCHRWVGLRHSNLWGRIASRGIRIVINWQALLCGAVPCKRWIRPSCLLCFCHLLLNSKIQSCRGGRELHRIVSPQWIA